MPKRGLIAGLLTAGGLALLFSFKTPATANINLRGAVVGSPPANTSFSNGTTGSGSTANTGSGSNGSAGTGSNGTGSNGTGSNGTGSNGSSATSTPAPVSGGGSPRSGTFTGQSIFNGYGNVEVQITVANGKVTDVQALQLPTDRAYSAQISQYVAPILRSEALQAQSAQISLISGATFTSEAYAQSLQSALQQAGI
jgi:uncharacterized protein with FMN-binding domain